MSPRLGGRGGYEGTDACACAVGSENKAEDLGSGEMGVPGSENCCDIWKGLVEQHVVFVHASPASPSCFHWW